MIRTNWIRLFVLILMIIVLGLLIGYCNGFEIPNTVSNSISLTPNEGARPISTYLEGSWDVSCPKEGYSSYNWRADLTLDNGEIITTRVNFNDFVKDSEIKKHDELTKILFEFVFVIDEESANKVFFFIKEDGSIWPTEEMVQATNEDAPGSYPESFTLLIEGVKRLEVDWVKLYSDLETEWYTLYEPGVCGERGPINKFAYECYQWLIKYGTECKDL